jgi:hypothetical protein
LVVSFVNLQIKNILFDISWIFSIKRIPFHYKVVEAAPQAPHIHFRREYQVFKNQFGWGVVDMPWKVVSLEQFFEIIGEANGIKFNNIVLKAKNPAGMYVPMNEIERMKVFYSVSDLPHNVEHFFIRELPFAEVFPLTRYLGCLHLNVDETLIFYVISINVNKVLVVYLA